MNQFKYSLLARQNYLFVECSGTNTYLDELMVFSKMIMTECERFKLTKVLMDSRWLKVKISMFTRYEFSNRLLEIPSICKLEVAVAVGDTNWEREKDLELFLNNRALPMYKIFRTIREAEKWLFQYA